MACLTDFKGWISEVDLESYDEIDSLYQTVASLSDCGGFQIKEAKGENNGWIVSCNSALDDLRIASEKARQYFLKYITDTYCDGMDEASWYAFDKANEKKD